MWPRILAGLALGLALVAAPAGTAGARDAARPTGGLTGLVPVTAHAVAAVPRLAPAAGASDTKHATGGWALGALPIALVAALGWLVVRRRGRLAPVAAPPRAVAARAPPSTVGT